MSIEAVQEATKIRSKYLLAIEAGDDSIAPGKAYFKVFLKSYATFLGLDGSELAQAYQSLLDSPGDENGSGRPFRKPDAPQVEKKPVPSFKESDKAQDVVRPISYKHPRYRRRRPKRKKGILLPAFLIFALVLAVWYGWNYFTNTEEPAVPGGVDEPVDEPDPPLTDPAIQEPPVEEPVSPTINRTDPDEGTTIFEINDSPLVLILSTLEGSDAYCWLRVTCDGIIEYEATMAPDSSREFTAQSEITVRAGKPWVLNIMLNSEDIGAGGPFGPVKDLYFQSVQE